MSKSTKKRKLSHKKIIRFIISVLVILLVVKYCTSKITNIYIIGSNRLKDNDIIELAGLENYPLIIKTPNFIVKKKLEKSNDIIKAKVYKKGTKIYIEILENRPLFYNSNEGYIVMLDKTKIEGNELTPYLSNYIPDTIYDKFVDAMAKVNEDILKRISEITYNPNSVDEERFYLTMSDGNYVYLTLNNFDRINSYIEMIKQFNGKTGILYLDSGEYFEIKN